MSRHRKLALTGVALLALTSLTTACAVSLSGGIVGVIVTVALGGLLFGLGGASSGCDTQPCLSPMTDQGHDGRLDAGADQGRPDVCLSVDAPWIDAPPADITPFDGPRPDADDPEVGPCLKPLPPDSAVAPCLKVPLDAQASLDLSPDDDGAPGARRRDELLARHAEALPADVLARLSRDAKDRRDA